MNRKAESNMMSARDDGVRPSVNIRRSNQYTIDLIYVAFTFVGVRGGLLSAHTAPELRHLINSSRDDAPHTVAKIFISNLEDNFR